MRLLVVLTAVVACLVVGCASPVAGDPAATSSPAPTAPAVELPPRPREVRLDDLDPCTLLTVQQRAELGLDREPLLDVGPSGLYGGVTQLCSILRLDRPGYALAVELSVTSGVEVFLQPGILADLAPIDVRGFPALEARSTSLRDTCKVAIDVAPGQLVDVHVSNGGATPVAPQGRLCERARQAADLVMATLLGLR